MNLIVTGPSGAGKTTLVNELRMRGYATVPEAARIVINIRLSDGRRVPIYDLMNTEPIEVAGFEKEIDDMQRHLVGMYIADAVWDNTIGMPMIWDRFNPDTMAYVKFFDSIRPGIKDEFTKICEVDLSVPKNTYAYVLKPHDPSEDQRHQLAYILSEYESAGYDIVEEQQTDPDLDAALQKRVEQVTCFIAQQGAA